MAPRQPIRLNGVVLPPQMIAAEAQHHPAKTPAAAFQAAARALVIRTLLLEEAGRQGLKAEPALVEDGKRELSDEAQIRHLLDVNVPICEPSDLACRAYYETHLAQFHGPDLFEASHILFAANPREMESIEKAKAAAASAISELTHQPSLFDALAGERSDCSSKSHGGRLGQLAAGDTVPEFETALRGLAPGQISPQPVRTRFGIHVIRLDARVAGEVLPFDYVRDKIAAFLSEGQWRLEAAAFIGRLVADAAIEGLEMGNVPQAALAS